MTQEYFQQQIVQAHEVAGVNGAPGFSIKTGTGFTWYPADEFSKNFLPLGNISHHPEYLQRLIAEFTALADKIGKLTPFYTSQKAKQTIGENTIGDTQIKLLGMQLNLMRSYLEVLHDRLTDLGVSTLTVTAAETPVVQAQTAEKKEDWTKGPAPIITAVKLVPGKRNLYQMSEPEDGGDTTDSIHTLGINRITDESGLLLEYTEKNNDITSWRLSRTVTLTASGFVFHYEADLQRGEFNLITQDGNPGTEVHLAIQRINHNHRQG